MMVDGRELCELTSRGPKASSGSTGSALRTGIVDVEARPARALSPDEGRAKAEAARHNIEMPKPA